MSAHVLLDLGSRPIFASDRDAVDAQVGLIEESFRILQSEVMEDLSRRKRLRNERAGIHRLPPDLLQDIVIMTLPSGIEERFYFRRAVQLSTIQEGDNSVIEYSRS